MNQFVADANVRTLLQVDTLLVMGLMSMTGYTSLLRLTGKVYATAEDYAWNGRALPAAGAEPASAALSDPIARVRRIHLNHLENVLPFLVLSTLYALTEPAHALFAGLLWAFFATRVFYTLFYSRSMQPHRTITFSLGIAIQVGIAVLTLLASFAA
ncbi:MAG TPA: MAPEG family protein [Polyangiaceae bacterium]|nr:MAPEG family protein [Polyangiaceae bacterium]